MGRPKTKSDEEILSVARRCILAHGAQVSTVHIADEVGLSQPALFKRFGTKNRLVFLALMPKGEPPFLDLVRQGPDQSDIKTQLGNIAAAMSEFYEKSVPCMMALSNASFDLHDAMRKMDTPPPLAAKKALAQWFERSHDMGLLDVRDFESIALTLMGALQSRAFMAHLTGVKIDASKHIETLIHTLINGMRPASASRSAP